MAAKDTHTMMERLRDETESCICTGTFVDPRVLPCLHTFCLKCLQTNVATLNRGQLMPCPVCRKQFNITASGLVGLQKNFLVERLIDIVRTPTSGTNPSSGIPCEACLEEMDTCLTNSVSPTKFYCADCQQKLCEECSVHHRKNKMTKLHNVSRLADDFKVRLKNCVKKCCDEHWSDIFVYCLDCMDDFCPRCSAHVHQLHRSSSRGKIIAEYTELVDAKVCEFIDMEYQVQEVMEDVDKMGGTFTENMDLFEKLVIERREKLKALVNSDAKLLLDEIKSRSQKTFEDISYQKKQLHVLLSSVIGYHEDCAERKEFPTIEALILAMNSMKVKDQQLKQLHEACMKRFNSSHLEVDFIESNIVDSRGNSNVVGQIEDYPYFQEYSQFPNLIYAFQARASSSSVDQTAVRGIALLGNELFLVHKENTRLYKYNASTFQYLASMVVCKLYDPCDIASCKSKNCLYVYGYDCDERSYRVFCLNTDGEIIRQWTAGKSDSSLSVTYDSNVLVAYRDTTTLKEYSEDGRLLRRLRISIKDGVYGFLHAHKLHSGLFLISYSGGHSHHGLSLVDGNGDVLKSVSETKGLGNNLDVPCFFAVDGEGCVLLVDKNNRRILLYSSDLERSVELVTSYRGLNSPHGVCLDEKSGRLFVADNLFDFRNREFGRVLVFQVKDV